MARATNFMPYKSADLLFLIHTHAEGRIAFASRAMCAPCHDDMARMRGWPRLPKPAMRFFNLYGRLGAGNAASMSLRTSFGGWAEYGGKLSSLAQNFTGSRSLLSAISRSH